MRNNSSSELNMNSSCDKTRSTTKKQNFSTVQDVANCKSSKTSKKRKLSDSLPIETPMSKSFSFNFVQHLLSRSMGENWHMPNSDQMQNAVVNQLKKFCFYHTYTPFERRVTHLTWHPTYPHLIVAGSKGGELVLYDTIKKEGHFCPGIGPDSSIVGLKFSPEDPCIVFTTSKAGNIRREDFTGKRSKNLVSTLTWENWFSGLDVCYKRKYILSGDCYGNGFLSNFEGDSVWSTKRKFHASRVTHCEFSQNDPNIFVTASVDHTVKLWDIRMVSESKMKPDPLRVFQHLKAVNSACFSPSNGLRLLTTDQHSELRVYSSPCWDELLTIKHPHRQFHHITPVKATWHPLKDIITVGRYPDDKVFQEDVRTIDFYDASNGELMHRINSPSGNIISLNAFNCLGDILASAASFNVMFLKYSTFKLFEDTQR